MTNVNTYNTKPVSCVIELNNNGHIVECLYTVRDLLHHIKTVINKYHPEGTNKDNSSTYISSQQKHQRSYSDTGKPRPRENDIKLRDLHRLDYTYTPQEEVALLIRRHAVLVALSPVRAVVMADKVLIFRCPDTGSDTVDCLTTHIKECISHNKDVNFEWHVLEGILGTVVEVFKQELSVLQSRAQKIFKVMKSFRSVVPVAIQEKTLQCKYEVSEQLQRAQAHKQIIEELMEDDEEMALMNLSVLKSEPDLYRSPLSPKMMETHEEIEALLDSYLMDYNALITQQNILLSRLGDAVNMMNLRSDIARNQLQVADLILTLINCACSLGMFLCALW
eukprot:CAMPEP_0185029866 /NCGR_PEP_ID=MMETSP1103-20130426/16469_1 /TAXON_ID=36769 /ORGANISM="Paraphysomonas bandaiensis, Strain Caron Lab Isolate" /LENGTH=334 /DNA_ID=CAMNT_0027564779 /DNA_START=17 /DNA_END=1018 /DNA_ORIENTATION=-